MAEVYIAIGGNTGDRARNMAGGLQALDDGPVKITRRSKIYEADSWGPIPQGRYYDAVVRGETALSPRDLLAELNRIEKSFGRDRDKEVRYGPRPLDLDILLYNGIVVNEPDLQIPHPLMLERAFVVVPLHEIAPDLVVQGRSVKSALEKLRDEAATMVAVD
jgi:2-amino-4-hydroxy-6-hydroxymethyldihydropteridine diphosphokinase